MPCAAMSDASEAGPQSPSSLFLPTTVVTVPSTCPLDEVSIHLDLCDWRARIDADY